MSQNSQEYDYNKLGLKVGIEIHQQLDTKGKLFCRCPNKMILKDPDFRLTRTFRPVLGEEGKFDKAMLLEFKKKTIVEYEGYHDSNCTYEFDETPPFECDQESLDIALEIGLLLNMNLIDELHICRKNYVDGSVPAGFQRTMVVGINGKLSLNDQKDMGIEILCLEEDACKRVNEEDSNKTIFRLDRLGIPLVEIATAPDLHTPEEARQGALRIGMLLRGTGKVKKQLGATRQDINVSIATGNRIEIKGVQKLDWIPPLVRNEVRRQLSLCSIRDQMKQRGISAQILNQKPIDITNLLKDTQCGFVNKGIKNNEKVWGLRVPKMKGLWGIEVQEGRRFGTEVANKIKVITGLKGLIHSDEDLNKYKFSENEIKSIREKLQCNEEDLFVLILGSEQRLQDAMDIVITRVIQALDGVPPETRKALEDGNNEFLRDLHGGARLYPDTDSREIIIDKSRVAKIKSRLPKYPWDLMKEYSEKFGIKSEIFEELLVSGNLHVFDEIMKFYQGKPTVVASTILDLVKSLRRDNYDVDNLSDEIMITIFRFIEEGKMAKEAIEPVLQYLCKNPEASVMEAMEKMNISSMSEEELNNIVQRTVPQFENLIKERGMGAMGPVMGAVMKEVRGKIDGKLVNQAVQSAIQKIISGKSPEIPKTETGKSSSSEKISNLKKTEAEKNPQKQTKKTTGAKK